MLISQAYLYHALLNRIKLMFVGNELMNHESYAQHGVSEEALLDLVKVRGTFSRGTWTRLVNPELVTPANAQPQHCSANRPRR